MAVAEAIAGQLSEPMRLEAHWHDELAISNQNVSPALSTEAIAMMLATGTFRRAAAADNRLDRLRPPPAGSVLHRTTGRRNKAPPRNDSKYRCRRVCFGSITRRMASPASLPARATIKFRPPRALRASHECRSRGRSSVHRGGSRRRAEGTGLLAGCGFFFFPPRG